jgi:hypothetical protein
MIPPLSLCSIVLPTSVSVLISITKDITILIESLLNREQDNKGYFKMFRSFPQRMGWEVTCGGPELFMCGYWQHPSSLIFQAHVHEGGGQLFLFHVTIPFVFFAHRRGKMKALPVVLYCCVLGHDSLWNMVTNISVEYSAPAFRIQIRIASVPNVRKILWYAEPLLGNDREIRDRITAVAT